METSEKQLSKLLKFVFWFVVLNSLSGALALILFSNQTEKYFFWNIAPPINAMLVGTMYLVAGTAVANAAIRGTWESARFVAAAGFSLSIVLLAATLIHIDRFIPGAKLYYWLIVYFLFPVLVVLLYWSYEKDGTNWQVIRQEIKPVTKFVATTLGAGMLIFVVIGFLFPKLIILILPWKLSELMVRVLLAWLTALAVSNLWFVVEKEWTRLQPVPYMLIAAPLVVAVMLLINRADLSDNLLSLWGFGGALLFVNLAGLFMLWQQRR